MEKLLLPETDVFYQKAMKRSAEIKARIRTQVSALSAKQILESAGKVNMLEGRLLQLNVPKSLWRINGDDNEED